MHFLSKLLFISLLGAFTLTSCKQKEVSYETRYEEEMAKPGNVDSLFLGFRLGMTSEDFFKLCGDLNKKQLVKQGSNNASVQYEIPFKKSAKMNFYPNFLKDTIAEMPVIFEYDDYAPWNKEGQSTELIEEVKMLMYKWHGGDWFPYRWPSDGKKVAIQIKGNRRIKVEIISDQYVKVTYTNLRKEMELQDLKNKLEALSEGDNQKPFWKLMMEESKNKQEGMAKDK